MEAVAKLSSSLEDYLEAIYHLECEKNSARASDIARRLNVSGASVTGALQALSRKGLVNYQPYRDITLTAQGCRLAAGVVHRHQTLHSFFVNVLDVDEELAQRAACRMEHSLPRQILERLQRFVEYIDSSGEQALRLIEGFKSDLAKSNTTVADEEKKISNGNGADSRPLSLIKPGESVRLIRIKSGNGLKQRMVAMGLLPGSRFEVIKNRGNGPVVLSVKGARLIVGRGMSERIMVSG